MLWEEKDHLLTFTRGSPDFFFENVKEIKYNKDYESKYSCIYILVRKLKRDP